MKRNLRPYFTSTLFLLAVVLIGFLFLFKESKQDLFLNLYSNTVFLILAILIIDRKNNDKAYRELIEQLISDMGGESNEHAKKAVRELKRLGISEGYELIDRDFSKANLERADLSFFNLNGANFGFANLRKTQMIGTSLISADFEYADLSSSWINGGTVAYAKFNNSKLVGANLNLTNCRFANFSNANLENAWLPSTNLEKADFSGANLKNAVFENAKIDNAIFSTKTIIPNGIKWKPGMKIMSPKIKPEVLNQE